MSTPKRRIPRTLAFVGTLGLALLLGGCPFFDDDPEPNSESVADSPESSESDSTTDDSDSATASSSSDSDKVCGEEVLPSPTDLSANPCSSGDKVVDKTVERTAGKPDRSSHSFEVDRPTEICLTVTNGSGGDARISAAWLYLDDELVFGPDEFDQQTGSLRQTLTLPPGEHQVRTRLASRPGASLRIEARAATHTTAQSGTLGDSGNLRVENIAVDHPLFSPNDDGYHDTALFTADNFPTNLPGKESGSFSYEIQWNWAVTDADSCSKVDAGLSGTTPVNSPTNVQVEWDGTDTSGDVVSDGNYIYQYHAQLVRSDGLVVDSVTATARGVVVDSSTPDLGIQSFGQSCDPATDEYDCECPEETPEGVRCTFAWIPYLTPLHSPSEIDTSEFLTSHRDQTTGRWEVVVDLRTFNGGGLVPQTDGTWASLDALQSYLSELTGVPADPDDTRLFNFDYTQFGYSTPVVRHKGTVDGFNHLLLDAITDADGMLTIDGTTIDLKAALRSSDGPLPDGYRIDERRRGDECGYNGNTDGDDDLRAKSCTNLRTANLDPGGSDLGIYIFKKRIFGVEWNGQGTVRDENCVVNGIFKCGVRTFQRNVDTMLFGEQFTEAAGDIWRVRDVERRASGLPAIVSHTDRGFPAGNDGQTSIIDGVCSSDSASRSGLVAPLDSGAGALPQTCVVNGIF